MKSRVLLCTGFIMLLICLSCTKQTTNWPQFRGINAAGIADEDAKPPIEFNEKNLLWRAELPEGHSSPCIWGDNIFLTGCDEDELKLRMFCIDRRDGEIKWQDSLSVEEFERVHATGNAAQSSAVTDGEHVCFYFGSYGLLCYDVSGQHLWEKKFPLIKTSFGVASSPILHGDKVILCRDVRVEARLYAFNKYNGDPIWISELPKRPKKYDSYPSHSTPVIWQDNILIHRCLQACAISLENGSPAWWIFLSSNGTSTPVVFNDLIYFGAWHEFSEKEQRGELLDFETMISRYDSDKDGLLKIDEIPEDMLMFDRPEVSADIQPKWYLRKFFRGFDNNKDGMCDSIEWNSSLAFWKGFYMDGGLIALKPDSIGELSPTSVSWKVIEKVPEVPSPIYYKNLVYMCKNGGILTCMDAQDGTVYYRERIGAAGGPYMASPVAANGNIYFPSMNGVVTVIKAGTELDILHQSKLGERICATPAIIGDVMYFRTDNSLVAYRN